MSEIKKIEESYEYRFIGGVNNTYAFKTDNGISYEVKFVPSGYIFEKGHPAYDFTFEFVILVVENNTGKNPPLDRKLPHTTAYIFQDFFREYRNVGVYICDSSDDKQAFRFRKFNNWFELFKGTAYRKFDAFFVDNDGTDIYTSLIMRMDNPNYKVVVDGYIQITEDPELKK
jgi:Family of unknown function (DUF6169)